jgi:CheY-like chemotaxis protein
MKTNGISISPCRSSGKACFNPFDTSSFTISSSGRACSIESTAGHQNLILLDLNVPRISGPELLLQTQTDESIRNIPVVMHSTSQLVSALFSRRSVVFT